MIAGVLVMAAAVTLSAATGPHPRLYLHGDARERLGAAATDGRAPAWRWVQTYADSYLQRDPPRRLEGDFRRAGELIPFAATCYLVTGEDRYLELARRYLLGLAEHDHWGDDRDIEAAHLLYGLAVGYDWLYDALSPGDRETIRAKLGVQAARLGRRAGAGFPALNNHRTVILASLGVAAHALGGEDRRADKWLATADRGLRDVLDHLGTEGFSPEGISYWSYVTEYLLKYALARPRAGRDLLDHPWLRHAADVPVYLALPPPAWTADNMFVNLDDSPRFCWYGPHYQLLALGAHLRRPEVCWLGMELLRAGHTRNHADWLTLLWMNPSAGGVKVRPSLPLTHRFAEWDVAVMRSGWDDGATVCVFRCTPHGGRHNTPARGVRYPGSGHAHPDANSFAIFGGGAWLAADAGATTVKRTAHHNTILVNGVGQCGEGGRWLDGPTAYRRGRVAGFVDHRREAGRDTFVGDASACYRPEAGLTRFRRHFTYARPGRFRIVDELETERDADFEWLLHTPGTVTPGDGRASIANGTARLHLRVIEPVGAEMRVELQEIPAEYPDGDWTNLTLLRISPAVRSRQQRFNIEMRIENGPPPSP